MIRSPPIFLAGNKKLKFEISNHGDFVEDIYREQEASKFYSILIGRSTVENNKKREFTTADIVNEGYLHKKGSWMKNWKKRYFILRKDIRALCYYVSREDLTLLGSVPLNENTTITNKVKSDEAAGFGNVIAIGTAEHLDTESGVLLYIRFDNFDSMKSWTIDINNEANSNTPVSERYDWWNEIYDQVPCVVTTQSSSTQRRGGLRSKGIAMRPDQMITGDNNKAENKHHPKNPSSRRTADTKHDPSGLPTFKESTPPEKTKAPDSDDEVDDSQERTQKPSTNAASLLKAESPCKPLTERDLEGVATDSDDESDYEEPKRTLSRTEGSVPFTTIQPSKQTGRAPAKHSKSVTSLQINRLLYNFNDFRVDGLSSTDGKDKKHYKLLKDEKPCGPPPFDNTTAAVFESEGDQLSGIQISLQLSYICSQQDRFFVAIFTSNNSNVDDHSSSSASATTNESELTTGIVVNDCVESPQYGRSPPIVLFVAPYVGIFNFGNANLVDANAKSIASLSSTSKWIPQWRTEVRPVKGQPEYGENYVHDYKIHFSVVGYRIPFDARLVRISVYRVESEINIKEPGKMNNLHLQLEMARAILTKKQFDGADILKVPLKVMVELPVDLAVPSFKEAQVIAGIIKVRSHTLHVCRNQLADMWAQKPYSEALFSFCSRDGITMSLEQLYATKYSASAAEALVSLWDQERSACVVDVLENLRGEFSRVLGKDNVSRGDGAINHDESTIAAFEPFKQLVTTYLKQLEDIKEGSDFILSNLKEVHENKKVQNAVIAPEVGGNYIRRSVWKKISNWQYCTTNLNIHLMASNLCPFEDLLSGQFDTPTDNSSRTDADNLSDMHFAFHITLGCPAAHELKYGEGGLRRVFAEIPTVVQKLRWMHAIQAASCDKLKELFISHPREAMSLFGNVSSRTLRFDQKDELPTIIKRKNEIAKRLDICGSQALGCAVTVIRTICTMASMHQGKYMDVLARSLSTGFLVLFESMLSTSGDELGMIEDLEIAALWLKLVAIRLVGPSTNISTSTRPDKDASDHHKLFGTEASSFSGIGDGVTCHTDFAGRIVFDVTLSDEEVKAVQEAQLYMQYFEKKPCPSDFGYIFQGPPIVSPNIVLKGGKSYNPNVVAVAEIFGLAFTQGVNEMQTVANKRGSHVQTQIDINNASFSRLEEFYVMSKAAIKHQLYVKAPEYHHYIHFRPKDGVKAVEAGDSFALKDAHLLEGRNSISAAAEKVEMIHERMLDHVRIAVSESASHPDKKHADILLKTSSLGRALGGTVAILCKSGKDRTSMGVTLETTRCLVEDLGVLHGQEICEMMRQQGVRRMNVYANTGQPMFAFNQIQRSFLPACYRPPHGSYSGNITS